MRLLTLALLALAALPGAAHGHHGRHHRPHGHGRVIVVAPPVVRPLAPPWACRPAMVAPPVAWAPAPVIVAPAPRPRVSVWIGF